MNHENSPVTAKEENVLELDAGNTRLKWRVLQSGQVRGGGFLLKSDSWRERLPRLLDRFGMIDLARVSLVSGTRTETVLRSIISDGLGIPMLFARPCRSRHGVSIAYEDASRLGVDRWLAMLAAHHYYPGRVKVIVDCGTALTLDIVDGQGRHLGGFIVPGLSMMRQSLQMNTADLTLVDEATKNGDLGKNTQECIGRGVLVMAAALIDKQARRYDDPVVLLAGGDAEQIEACIDVNCALYKDIVMDGLALAFD